MAKIIGMFRTTVTGGVLFLLPIIIIIFVLEKGFAIARGLFQPVVTAIGLDAEGRVLLGTTIAILSLIAFAFVAGLIARTRFGQSILSFFEHSILGYLPQFRMARGLAQSIDPEGNQEVEVVLVPTNAGWTLGIVLERPEGEWWSVFVPDAPHWTSGSLVYAHADQVRPAGISFAQAVMLMRRCGAGSQKIRSLLTKLRQEGEV